MNTHTIVTTAIRVKALTRGVLLCSPADTQDRTVLKPLSGWEVACDTYHPLWLVLPGYQNRGLPLKDWKQHWDDLKVEVEVLQADNTWHDYFES